MTFGDDILNHVEHANGLAVIIRKREDEIIRLKEINRQLVEVLTKLIHWHDSTTSPHTILFTGRSVLAKATEEYE